MVSVICSIDVQNWYLCIVVYVCIVKMTNQTTWKATASSKTIKCVSFPVKQKQAELDDLNFKLHCTQKYNEALHGDVKAKKNFNQKTRTQKKIAEEQKLQQVMSRLKLEIQRVGFSVMV